MRMEENRKKKSTKGVGRKPKSDPAVHRYVVRLNSEENGRFNIQFQKSGLKEHSKFIKAMLFGHEIKVVKIDKATMDYYIRLTNFYHQFQGIGNNYNQTVKAVKTNFGEKRAYALLRNLEKATIDLVVLSKRIIMLTHEFEEAYLIKRGVSLYGAIVYNQQKVDDATARIIYENRMITDVTGNPEQVMRQTIWAFENYLLANKNTEKPVLHI